MSTPKHIIPTVRPVDAAAVQNRINEQQRAQQQAQERAQQQAREAQARAQQQAAAKAQARMQAEAQARAQAEARAQAAAQAKEAQARAREAQARAQADAQARAAQARAAAQERAQAEAQARAQERQNPFAGRQSLPATTKPLLSTQPTPFLPQANAPQATAPTNLGSDFANQTQNFKKGGQVKVAQEAKKNYTSGGKINLNECRVSTAPKGKKNSCW